MLHTLEHVSGGLHPFPKRLLVRPPTAYQQSIQDKAVLAVLVERLPKRRSLQTKFGC
jgi:hypothetical protein